MNIYLWNTLTKRKEKFEPVKKGLVKMYHCGPTVYDYVHIGNLRAYVFADILRRTLEFNGLKIKQVINITDIGHLSGDGDLGEDKMTSALKREGKKITLKEMKKLADFYAKKFAEDLVLLNIKKPHKMPKASKHVLGDIKLIKKLEEKGLVYKTSDGLYFDTSKTPEYGKLGGISNELSEARIEENSDKRNPRDFALWKLSDDKNLGWKSPWGLGFPGWHIECSVMAMEYLGETLDIHTSGIDHIPTHHNNEIAQSESATGKTFSRFWMHNEFLNIAGEKMAKSSGNFLKLKDILEKSYTGEDYRYYLLGAHYRAPMNFSEQALEASKNALEKIRNIITETKGKGKIIRSSMDEFKKALDDDLDTPKALAILWSVLKDDHFDIKDRKATILEFDKVLGLHLSKKRKKKVIPSEVRKLVEERETARKNGNFKISDELRDKIKSLGFEVNDTEEGTGIVSSK